MFTKRATGYWYDADPLRVQLNYPDEAKLTRRRSQPTPGWDHGIVRKDGLRRASRPGDTKAGVIRRDGDRTTIRVFPNPLGLIHDAIWHIAPASWTGLHSSVMPGELVRRCLLLTCPPGGRALDPFGGAGTVSVVAKRLGLRSLYIDRHAPFVAEARKRLASTIRCDDDDAVANDNQSPETTVAD
jgi:hypothetical protein